MEFPGFVYRSPGSRISAGRCFDLCSVGDEAALAEKLAAGWSETVEAAYKQAGGGFIKPKVAGWRSVKKVKKRLLVPPVIEPPDDSPATREELVAKATELGLQFSKLITDKTLLKRINTVIEDQ